MPTRNERLPKFNETLQRRLHVPQPFFRRELQILPQKRPVDVLLEGVDHRIGFDDDNRVVHAASVPLCTDHERALHERRLVTFVSSFKFIWAPFVDRGRIPVLTAIGGEAGRRRTSRG